MLDFRRMPLILVGFTAILFTRSSVAQRRISDVASIDALAKENPAGYSFAISGPEEVAKAEPITIRFAYSQPDREAGSELPTGLADYWFRGFLLRGPIACGMPRLPCPTPDMIREDDSSIQEQRSLSIGQWNGSANLRKFLPALPPGDYVVYAIMQPAEFHPLSNPRKVALRRVLGRGDPPSYLVSAPYRFRIKTASEAEN